MENRKRQRYIGSTEVWYTRARRQYQSAAGPVGGYVWLCPACGYWPDSTVILPEVECYNCKQRLLTTVDDPLALPITVRVTEYGYEPKV